MTTSTSSAAAAAAAGGSRDADAGERELADARA